MQEFFIVTSFRDGYGYYGKGNTLEAARKRWRAAGGRKCTQGYKEFRFTSELPFAPMDRDATEQEADAWVTRYGELQWLRCNREELCHEPAKK